MKNITVIGAGQMGAGIAQVSALNGYLTVLSDISDAQLDKARAGVEKSLCKFVEKSVITEEDRKRTLANISYEKSLENAAGEANLVIEAIVENFTIKAELFEKLDQMSPSSCLFASNTSSISITKLAAQVSRPSDFIGVHFMNPVPLMELVEIIRGIQTSDETYKKSLDLLVVFKKPL